MQAALQVGNPLPVVNLPDGDRDEHRPRNHPDLVMNPFPYDQETRNEDFRYYQLPIGTVQSRQGCPNRPALYRSDPDVEVLCFPHLYPYSRGQFLKGEREGNGRSVYTRHMDIKRKLNSYNRSFHDDWYWAAWAYQEMESTRIFQNTNRLINNKMRQAIDGRLPQHQLLQQSNYGRQSIINEALTYMILACIHTGEAYFLEKERVVNSIIASYKLPQLFVTLTFNESWPEFYEILQGTPTRVASNHPWEGIQYYY